MAAADLSMIKGTYAGSKFNNKYQIEQLVYPANLQSNEYDGNKVIFYINIAEDSKFATNNSDFVEMDGTDVARNRGTLIAQNLSLPGLMGSAVAGLASEGAAVGGLAGISSFEKGSGGFLKNALSLFGKTVGGGVIGAIGAAGIAGAGYVAVANMAASATRKQRRLKSAIALHTPNSLQIRYSTNWQEEYTATGAMFAAGGEALSKFFDSPSMTQITDKNGPLSSIIGNIALTKGPNAGMVSAATGLADNPRKEQVFKGVDFRTFTFDYQFFPKSIDEATNVETIIKMFKFHMHPELKDTNSFVYLYPSEFDIIYYKGADENRHIHRHTSCVLVDMTVNYTPNGNFNTFDNGMPTQINITMQFKELATMDKDLIANGL